MDYYEFTFTVIPSEPYSEILVNALSEAGFESFSEEGELLLAYIPAEMLEEERVEEAVEEIREARIIFSKKLIPSRNWNEVWEAGFSPVRVGNLCLVRAPFHPAGEGFKMEIVIEPKMSFGTGHHDTTYLMLEKLLSLDLEGKSVLDMGCGTGILAIAACKSGAGRVEAIDNNEYAWKNSLENAENNNCSGILVNKGDSSLLAGQSFHVILANINRNVLMHDLPVYSDHLEKDGYLLISGFFETDIPLLAEKAEQCGLKKTDQKVRNSWAIVEFTKR